MRFTPLAAVAVIVAISTCTPSDSGRVAAPRIAAAHDGDFAGAPDLIVDGKALEGSWVVYDQILKEGTCTLEEGGVLDPTVPHRVVRFTVNTPNIGDADIALGDPAVHVAAGDGLRSEEHTSELQSQSNLVCRLLLEKKKTQHLVDIRREYPPSTRTGDLASWRSVRVSSRSRPLATKLKPACSFRRSPQASSTASPT